MKLRDDLWACKERRAFAAFAFMIQHQLTRRIISVQFVCNAPTGALRDASRGKTWFRIETEAEAIAEASAMRHAVDQYFIRAQEQARASYRPVDAQGIERDIGLKSHIARSMPLFLTLRADDGEALVTAMLAPDGRVERGFRVIIVGPNNADPYPLQGEAIAALAAHFDQKLERERCYPYA